MTSSRLLRRMDPRRFDRAAGWAVATVTVLLVLITAWAIGRGSAYPDPVNLAMGVVLGIGMGVLGAFIVTRQPTHPIGWLLILSGLLRAAALASGAWAVLSLGTAGVALPGGAFAAWLSIWTLLLGLTTAPMVLVLFPDGRLPAPLWWIVPALSGGAALLFGVVAPVEIWPFRGAQILPGAPTPAGGQSADAVIAAGEIITGIAVTLALASVVVRFRRSRGTTRQQIKWFGFGGVAGFVLNMAALLPGLAWLRPLGAAAVLTGICLGIFRYRLYDLDRLINRTLVYGLLTVSLIAGFAALVITLAAIFGGASTLVAAGSAFVMALLLKPLRDRVQDLVDRVFDRRNHDRRRALRRLAAMVGHQVVEPDLVVDAIRKALDDPGAQVIFEESRSPASLNGHRSAVPVVRSGERIATLLHDVDDPALVKNVIHDAMPLLEHAGLQAALRIQLAEVQASRARLATAHDAERRRIERDLHDGAQQRLVGLALHIESAKRRDSFPDEINQLLSFTVEQLNAELGSIRALVHGVLPPALTSGGLCAAVAEMKSEGINVTCNVGRRLDPDVEATAWFVASEGVANATKHAPHHPIEVEVSIELDQLIVRVTDSGRGGADPNGSGLRNLADRVEAHGGTLRVDSSPAGGTQLQAFLPCGS